MDYNNAELIERLAAEYVLGTLRGRARDRFETLMCESYKTRLAVWSWETQISPLGTVAIPIAPPPDVWNNIRGRLGHHQTENTGATTIGKLISWWHDWSLAAVAASFLVFAVVLLLPQLQPQVDQVAIFTNQNAQPQWLVSFDPKSGELSAKALNASALETGEAFELWALPETGDPQSLGLLPVSGATTDRRLPSALIELLKTANGLAVSVEPPGGSPTGLPTGPVVFQSQLIEL